MTEKEILEQLLLEVTDQALEFCKQTGEPIFNDLTDEQFELFSSGAIAGATIILEGLREAIELQ